MLFADLSDKSVPAMYLQFLENLATPKLYNWGEAVLACLYSNLSRTALKKTVYIGGPMLFLQFWSWSHISVGRPVCSGQPLGGPIAVRRPPLGVMWVGKHDFRTNPHGGGVEHYREQLDKLLNISVNWTPFRVHFDIQPTSLYAILLLEFLVLVGLVGVGIRLARFRLRTRTPCA